jgi:hypothetical protein
MAHVTLHTAGQVASDAIARIQDRETAASESVPMARVPVAYTALTEIAAPGRKTLHMPTFEAKIGEALKLINTPASAPSLMQRWGLSSGPVVSKQTRALADELLALAQVGNQGEAARAAQFGANGLRA